MDNINTNIDFRELFDCKNIQKFVHSIKRILPWHGISESIFSLCEFKGSKFLVKICFYTKKGPELYVNIPKKYKPWIETEIEVLKILKKNIVDTKLTPCILDIFYLHTCLNFSKFFDKKSCTDVPLQPDSSISEIIMHRFCYYTKIIKKGLAYDKISFMIIKMYDLELTRFILRNVNSPIFLTIFKSILFQIIYTIYIIKKIYPGFVHYDLHTDNILLSIDNNYKFKVTNPKFLKFLVEDEEYLIPYFGFTPKIIDYGFCKIPEEGIMSTIHLDPEYAEIRSDHDLITLLHFIYTSFQGMYQTKNDNIFKILDELDPTGSYIIALSHPDKIKKISSSINKPLDMLRTKPFNEYKKYNVPENMIYDRYGFNIKKNNKKTKI